MTLTAYLSLLSLGSSIQRRSSSDSFEREEQVLQLLEMDAALTNAEVDIVNAVSQHSAPAEEKEARESAVAVGLTMGTMVANYVLCFPIVVARHRLQAFPIPGQSDTPVAFAHSLYHTYRSQGPVSLYSGIGLGLLSQAVTGAYDSYAGRSGGYGLVPFATKTCLGTGLFALLYPFYRSALIVRVQTAGTHRLIRSVKDFALSYASNLARFFTPRHSNQLPILSLFIPWCLTQILTERLLLFLYHRIYPLVSFRKSHAWPAKRLRPQQQRQQQQQQHRRARRHAVETPRIALESSLLADLDPATAITPSSRDRRREEAKPLRTFYPEMVSGIASSIIARTLIFPIDTIVYNLLLQDSGIQLYPTHFTGFFDCIRQTYSDRGLKGFFPAWGGLVVEIAVSYLILEGSWMVYRLADWKLSKYPTQEPQSVRKARHLRERLNS